MCIKLSSVSKATITGGIPSAYKRKKKIKIKIVRDAARSTTSNKIFRINNRNTRRYVMNATLCLLGWDEAGWWCAVVNARRVRVPQINKQPTYG